MNALRSPSVQPLHTQECKSRVAVFISLFYFFVQLSLKCKAFVWYLAGSLIPEKAGAIKSVFKAETLPLTRHTGYLNWRTKAAFLRWEEWKVAGLSNGITNVITAGGVNVIHCCWGKQAFTEGFGVFIDCKMLEQLKMEILLRRVKGNHSFKAIKYKAVCRRLSSEVTFWIK